MSLTTLQKYQMLRLVVPNATVDNEEQYALLGITEPVSYAITAAQKKQLLRLPVVDASVDTSDKWAFLGIMQPLNPGGPTIEIFNVDWTIDPTWTASELPQATDGAIAAEIEAVRASFIGTNVDPLLEAFTAALKALAEREGVAVSADIHVSVTVDRETGMVRVEVESAKLSPDRETMRIN